MILCFIDIFNNYITAHDKKAALPLFCMFLYISSFGNISSTLNRSPSRYSCIFPFISSVRLCAMDRPSPLPSVFLDSSPCTNRSSSSSGLIFSSLEDMFLKLITVFSSRFSAPIYALVPFMPWRHIFSSRLSITLHSSRPSAVIYISSSGKVITVAIPAAVIRSPYSATDWRRSSDTFTLSRFTLITPD